MLRGSGRAVFLYLAVACGRATPLDDLGSYVPADAMAVGRVDVASLGRSRFVRKLLDTGQTTGARALPATCGYDALARTKTLGLVIPRSQPDSGRNGRGAEGGAGAGAGAGDLGVFAVGRFDEERLLECARVRARDRGSSLGEHPLHGLTLHFDRDLPGGAIAFPKRGVVLGGTRGGLRQMIETARGSRERMQSSSEHYALVEELGRDRQMWFVARIPEDVRRHYLEQADEDVRPFLAVSWLAIGLRFGTGVHVSAVVRATDEPAARRIESMTRGLLAKAREEPVFALSPFGPLFRGLEVDREGNRIVLGISLAERQMDRMAEGFDELERALAGE